jgi:methyltransferase
MVVGERAYLAILIFIAAERIFELTVSRRNATRLIAHGGIERGSAHYLAIVAMHTAWLVACVVESVTVRRSIPAALSTGALLVTIGAQALRYWAVWTLGERWSTRIIVMTDIPPATNGPYRYLRHPNYVAVILEVAALPLVRANWYTAILFSIANAIVLAIRIPIEERALGERWRAAFESRRRFLPL